uniref:Autophagy-related protein 3 n=1 Tax=Phaeomonas parva TaxID=124430 RepID=A0A7S1XN90_9STRA|mmetsp:Transcript_19516/g.59040  ORF Transcript_19516/g.59040 Transcript_19516/m.59040 type:complete len:377 (+) Transcript_19516:232-1362(+)
MALLYLKGIRESVWPTLKDSQFLEKGQLTPEEFVAAGDALVRLCPTWSWEGGEASRQRGYLPPGKQYLITRGVPSRHRVADMEGQILADDFSQTAVDSDSEWMIPALRTTQVGERVGGAAAGDVDDDYEDLTTATAELSLGGAEAKSPTAASAQMDLSFALVDDYLENEEEKAAEAPVVAAAEAAATVAAQAVPVGGAAAAAADEDDEYCDILDFEDANIAVDATTLPAASASPAAAAPGAVAVAEASAGDATIRTRRYDVSISYDNYWRSPRIWLFGFNESGVPLQTEETFEDIISDYRERTVTIDPHPHTGVPHASVHPCQHAATMKRIVENIMDGGGEAPRADEYLFVFLKFIQSVVPTIDYDFTMQVEGRRA